MHQAHATKTVRQPLEYRPGLTEWFATTQQLFNQVATFHWQVLDAYPGVLELSSKDALTALEGLTHTTMSNPAPVMPLAEIASQVPAYFRRAAIHAALGAMRSFQSHLAKWNKAKAKAVANGKACRERPPVPPRTWQRAAVFYARMYKDVTGRRITLKLYDGQTWRWVRFSVQGQALPTDWEQGSPQAVQHGERWWLHVPLQRTRPRAQPVATQLASEPSVRLCAVDLNINDALAVCTIQTVDGTVVASRFLRGGDELHGRRKTQLGRIARNRRKTGLLAEGEQDNRALWAKVRHLDEHTAHQISRRILDFASRWGASLLVFEHLGSFRPERGKYSRRANAKRSYWLRGKIVRFSRYKAWNQGIVTCRVNPKNTSRRCAQCGTEVARYGAGEPREGYRPGAPLSWCPRCRREVNADFNASRNIGQRLVIRYQQTQQKQQTGQEKPPTRSSGARLRKGQVSSPPKLPQGMEEATGTAPPD